MYGDGRYGFCKERMVFYPTYADFWEAYKYLLSLNPARIYLIIFLSMHCGVKIHGVLCSISISVQNYGNYYFSRSNEFHGHTYADLMLICGH